jgi:hypothetical protein
MAIEADASVTARWPGLLRHVREAFDARDDIDRCARVTLTLGAAASGRRVDRTPALSPFESIAVEVELPDGRFASRSVSRPEDLAPTLEALLLLPRRDAQVPTTPVASGSGLSSPTIAPPGVPGVSSPSTADVPVHHAPTIPTYDASPSSTPAQGHLRVELSLEAGARFGDGQSSVGVGALSFLDLSAWLVGFEGRLDRYRKLAGPSAGDAQGPPDGAAAALELAVLGGRRVRLDGLALDFLLGLAAAVQGTTTSQTQTPTGTITRSSSSDVPRLLLASRLNVGARSTVHTFVSIDGELGPTRAGGDVVPGAPRLPIWTLGLALGATVGTP